MIGTEVLVEGYLLDVVSGADFSFNYAVSDVREPDKRQTEFTKTIRCAGTANNNTLFGNLFEADIANLYDASLPNIGANFNPNKKASVQVLHNSLPQLDGSMQLRKISITEGLIEYEVVFIGKLIDIFGVWGDQQLNGRDDAGNRIIELKDLNHTLNQADVIATWSAPVGVGYVYPLIDWGRGIDIDVFGVRSYPANHLRPCVYLQDLWNRIFAYANSTYEGSFFTDGVFERLIIPFNSGFALNADDLAKRQVTGLTPSAPFSLSVPFLLGSGYGGFIHCTDITTDNYAAQLTQTAGSPTALQTFTPAFNGSYRIEGSAALRIIRTTATGNTGGTPVTFLLYVNGIEVQSVQSSALPNISFPFTVGTIFDTVLDFTFSELDLSVGDSVRVMYLLTEDDWNALNDNTDTRFVTGTTIRFAAVNSELYYGDTVRLNEGMPDVSIKEFFLSILKMFNLYMTPSKTVDRHYIFQTRNDYYASGVLRDWTYKLARDRQLSVTPMGLLSGREYVYTYSEDGDYYNERYHGNFGKVYGNRTLNIDNDFVPERKETSIVFSPTPLCNDGNSSRIIPKIYDADISEGSKASDVNIRILYYGGMLASSPNWKLTGDGELSQSTYPYAGHWDNPITPTLDINFGICFEYYYIENGSTGTLQVTNNNLFKKYHEAQFLELSSKDSKLITAMFYLTELDIQQLDFRDTILIDQTYYRINKVIDYNPFKTGLTKVELFKAGDIVMDEKKSAAMGSGKSLGSGRLLELAPLDSSKKLFNGNQFEPFQGKVIGRENVVTPNAVGFFVQGDNNRVGASKNVTLIGSNNVVADGVENVTAIGVSNLNITQSNTTINGDGGVQVATLELTSAQILALNTTPVSFGITVPTGYYACPLFCQFSGDFNTVSYATATTITVYTQGSASLLFSGNLLAFGVDTFVDIPKVFASVNNAQFLNGKILVSVSGASNPTAGNSTVKLYLTYILVQI
jgi:hypothetical protein